jgi:dTDP-4-dehydrorhamnose 3,5-epimerase
VEIQPLAVANAFVVSPQLHCDDRGLFLEWYRADELQKVVGHPLDLRQANSSVSRKGVVRGIHFADIPPGQAKYVTCPFGAVLDFVIDLRVGSPTFGEWDSVVLDDVDRRAVYLAEGLGHAFVSLTDNAVVNYLVSDVFRPEREHGITPLDSTIGLVFPSDIGELSLSDKDTAAPTLENLIESGVLPTWGEAQDFYETLRLGSED